MTALTRITLPSGMEHEENLLWQGAPSWRQAAIRIWHVRLVAAWFTILSLDGATLPFRGLAAPAQTLADEARLCVIAMAAIGLVLLLAWMTTRTTLYTITDRRIVMQFGIALRARLEIPFAAILHVSMKVHADHSGDIALRLRPHQRAGFAKLYPYVRAWSLLAPEPMLRAVPKAASLGAALARAMAAAEEYRAHFDPAFNYAARSTASLPTSPSTVTSAMPAMRDTAPKAVAGIVPTAISKTTAPPAGQVA
jgi:hypothetical protein